MRFLETWAAIQNDLKVNIYLKSYYIVTLYRLAHYFMTGSILLKVIGSPVTVLYLFTVKWIIGVEIPPKTRIGKGFVIYHGYGLVINSASQLGDNVVVRQGCCIGNTLLKDGSNSEAPVIGNNVDFGVNAVVLGPVVVADNVKIGAGAVVVKDCDFGSTYVGVPARKLPTHQ